MGYVPDERLSRMFEKQQVTFFEPPNSPSWFHLFLIHQNLQARGSMRTFRLDLLPHFLNLVIWGHEHECKVELARSADGVRCFARRSRLELRDHAAGIVVRNLAHQSGVRSEARVSPGNHRHSPQSDAHSHRTRRLCAPL